MNCGSRYIIKNVRFQKGVVSSQTSHEDGDAVRASWERELWVIEDGPDDYYRSVVSRSSNTLCFESFQDSASCEGRVLEPR